MKKLFGVEMEKIRAIPRSLRGKISITFTILVLVLLAIIVAFYVRVGTMYSQAILTQSAAVETVQAISDIEEMYTMVFAGVVGGQPDQLERYRQAMDRKLVSLQEQKALNDAYFHYYRDLYELHSYFDKIANRFIQNSQKGMSLAVLRNRMPNLVNILQFITSKLVGLMEAQIKDGHETLQNVQISLLQLRLVFIAATICAVLLFFLLGNVFIKRFLRPLDELTEYTAQIESGNYESFIPRIRPLTEVETLIDAYNGMSAAIRNLLDTTEKNARIESELKEQVIANLQLNNMLQEAELDFLRSQLNPHFLFNTLNTAISMANVEHIQGTKDILLHMSYILRYALASTSRFVRLQEEVELAKHYLEIQQIRFKDRLKTELFFDPSLNEMRVPPMILQPFIENAIIHGIAKSEKVGTLGVFIFNHGTSIVIHIRDNSVGMSEEQLARIMNDDNELKNRRHGIYYVMKRLKIIYKTDIVSIDSKLGFGTDVCLTLPMLGEIADEFDLDA